MIPEPLLCIDTSTPIGSVAIYADGGLFAGHTQRLPRGTTERLFSTVEWLLDSTGLRTMDLGGVAVASGPGSFTGLRIGSSAAKTMAWTAGKPLYAICSLKALAFGAACFGLPVCAWSSAGQNELYAACYRWIDRGPGEAEELLSPVALNAEKLTAKLSVIASRGKITCVGSGTREFREKVLASLGGLARRIPQRFDLPNAAYLGELVQANPEAYRVDDVLRFEPHYLRVSQAELRLKS